MKPCSNKRKLIALLALEELASGKATELRAHLQSCAGCHSYFEQISGVTQKLAATSTTPPIETSARFHRKLVARLHDEPASSWESAKIFLQMNWRVALPVAAASLVLVLGLSFQLRRLGVATPNPVPPPTQTVSAPEAEADLTPSIANYQSAADQSLQKFDDLLNQQAKQSLPSAPVYAASTLKLPDSFQ